jgi:hypothetical protein
LLLELAGAAGLLSERCGGSKLPVVSWSSIRSASNSSFSRRLRCYRNSRFRPYLS